jgi:hypothetical protein
MDGLPGTVDRDDQGAARVARPEQADVWTGLDVGRENHFAQHSEPPDAA